MSIDSYQPGDVALVQQNVASAGIKRDEAYQIAEIVGKAIQLQNMETGNRLEINLETSRKLVGTYCVYETEKRKFSKSEQVKFRITDTESGIKNGITGTITNISDKSVTVKISDGSTATLAAESIPARGMDHTHALTGHDYQGATVDKIIIAISANYSNVMWGRNTAYVLRGAVSGFRAVC